jgi:outer membrane protein TolC
VSAALVRRPEIAAARADVRAEEAALRAAHRGVLPALTVQAGYTTGVDTGINVSGPSANVTLNVPLSNAASGRARAEAARLAQAQARAAAASQTVTVEVSTAYESLRAQREAVAASASARSEAQAEVRAAQAGYREGASSSLDLADARRTYAQAAVADAIARAALTQAALTFGLALGEEGP